MKTEKNICFEKGTVISKTLKEGKTFNVSIDFPERSFLNI